MGLVALPVVGVLEIDAASDQFAAEFVSHSVVVRGHVEIGLQ